MKILAYRHDKEVWNDFVRRHYPPVGNFMLSWEWGAFQKKLGRATERFAIEDDAGATIGLFTLVYYPLPFGFKYAYLPRGPLVAVPEGSAATFESVFAEALRAIEAWAKEYLRECIFLRLEPPVEALPLGTSVNYRVPDHYVQPRYNLALPLSEDLRAMVHPSTRSNINRAERRGASVLVKESLSDEEYADFKRMVKDTIKRNSGVNAYPDEAYFRAFLKTFAEDCKGGVCADGVSLKIFCGYRDGDPAGTHLVLYYADTATYLFGASLTKHLDSKISTYLHMKAAEDAQKRGYRYYDIGGIDPERWPTLTEFKRQFRGTEFCYMGNMDILLRPRLYTVYTLVRKVKGFFHSLRQKENKKPAKPGVMPGLKQMPA
ncbi:MAG TPA: peptidoglycan bridge formation glycyltransferase FemA/FemB family protein [Candidatus Paceibacterota bacterium]|nr:peptidoglycan bridge formation glycyltransferase FemA/FemB family protein [Candidatus Paceibacterota bacterium]